MKTYLIKYSLNNTGEVKSIIIRSKNHLEAISKVRGKLSYMSNQPIIIMEIYEKLDIIRDKGE